MNKKQILLIALAAAGGLVGGILCAGLVSGGVSFPSDKTNGGKTVLHAPAIAEHPSEKVEYDMVIKPQITSNIWYGEAAKAHEYLLSAKQKAGTAGGDYSDVSDALTGAITELGSFSRYFEYIDKLSYETNGKKYGAYVEDGDSPIGGGLGYKDIKTRGDYNVRTLSELTDALSKAKSGETVFIYGDAEINISSIIENGGHLSVGAGVTLASDRGRIRDDGTVSTGALIYSTTLKSYTMNVGEGGRVTGITLKGGDPDNHLAHHFRSFSANPPRGNNYYYSLSSISIYGISCDGDNIEVDNCEIGGYAYAGVSLAIDVKDAHVHHCYIHHNQGNGLGYGVVHGNGATSVIEYNLFNYNRHSIAATGKPTTGYIARFNIEMGASLEHCFDMHGGSDRGDGTNIAGTYCEMYNNTFLVDTYPYWLRGVPEDHQTFYQNIVFNPVSFYDKSRLTNSKAKFYDNIFGIDKMTLVK